MGKAIVYVAFSGGAALVSGLWYGLDRGEPALLTCLASVLAIVITSPILLRKDFQFVGIPGAFEIFFALGALVTAILGGVKESAGVKGNPYWFWCAVLVQTIPSIRISLVSLKAYQRPKSLKISVGIVLAALFAVNVLLGIRHSDWLGKNSVALVKEWFPEATSAAPPAPVKKDPKPVAPPAPPQPSVDPEGPVAVVVGRPLTREMVEYQRFIDSLIDERIDRDNAIAALLQAFTARAILDQKFKSFDPEMLRDERQWVMNRTKDSKLIHRIRTHKTEQLFLDVYVGANGLYKRKLQEIFEKRKRDELKLRAAEVLREIQSADGVERPGPKVDAVEKDERRYSFRKGDFIPKYELESDEQVTPRPGDALAEKLAKLPVNTTMPEIQWGDMNARIFRRVQDDFQKRPIFEVYRIVESGVFTAWFKKQCAGMVIEIPDPVLRKQMLELAKDVTHIIKAK